MPSGDARCTWFPELVEILRSRRTGQQAPKHPRHEEHPVPHDVVSEMSIATPLSPATCLCGAAILALGRFDVAEAETVKKLERRWKKHRQEYQLDLYGSQADRQTSRDDVSH